MATRSLPDLVDGTAKQRAGHISRSRARENVRYEKGSPFTTTDGDFIWEISMAPSSHTLTYLQ